MTDRDPEPTSWRIGLSQPATVVDDDLDLVAHVRAVIAGGTPVDTLICDEAQFYTAAQIEQLAVLVDDLDVQASGPLTDLTTQLFPGTKRLLELADRRQELQVEARCWCGDRGTLNARTIDGRIQREGEQVVVGDIGDEVVAYEVLCRRHHRQGITSALAHRDPDAAVDEDRRLDGEMVRDVVNDPSRRRH